MAERTRRLSALDLGAGAAVLLALAGVIWSPKLSGAVSLVIRNQPHGQVAVKQVIPLQRKLSAVFADGRVVSAVDPNQEQFATIDARFVLQGEGRKGADGVVFGNQNLKIGAPIELEGSNFRVIGSVTGLRLGAN